MLALRTTAPADVDVYVYGDLGSLKVLSSEELRGELRWEIL